MYPPHPLPTRSAGFAFLEATLPQSTPAAGHAPRPERRATAPALADALENPRDDLDRLIGDLRLATRFSQADFDRAEERMQMICAALMQPFRGGREPSASPLWLETRGGKCSALF
ncbi:hypothetical protein M527_07105 [Sphingobium indicum IP26]|nr:hypothetical protein M527_07105 [Sphingobium indicum IP26]